MSKSIKLSEFKLFQAMLPKAQQELLDEFFISFDNHCRIAKRERRLMRRDFEEAILYYAKNGVPVEEAVKRLNPENLGAFYSRPASAWFALDDAAKVYPLSMDHGRMDVFRVSVYFKEEIIPQLLAVALAFTVKRFPTFGTAVKKGFFWHYLNASKSRFAIEPEQRIPCLPIRLSFNGCPAFRVIYYKNRLSVELFHVLADGTGAITFLKVLAAEYLRLTGVDIVPDENLWDVNELPSAEESENAFLKVDNAELTNASLAGKAAMQLSGRLSRLKPCQVLHFKMDADALKAAAASYGATVTVFLLTQIFHACRAATEDLEGEFSVQVPVNMRKFYPSKTVRNFSMYCGIRMTVDEITRLSIEEQAENIKNQLAEKGSKESLDGMVTSSHMIVSSLRFVPLAVKQAVMQKLYGVFSDMPFTTTLSNLGVVKLPENLYEYIESMDFILGPAITNRLSCSVVTFAGKAVLSISKNTADPAFEEALYKSLTACGVEVEVEGSALYEN